MAAKRGQDSFDPRGLPDKPFFKIGEAARICGVKPYVLRYWETEFRSLRPQKTTSGQRLYKRSDLDLLLRIRELLYDRRFTIEGARTKLREEGRDEVKAAPVPAPDVDRAALLEIKSDIVALLAFVEDS